MSIINTQTVLFCFVFFLFDSRFLREEAKHSCCVLQPELHLGEGIAAWDLKSEGATEGPAVHSLAAAAADSKSRPSG